MTKSFMLSAISALALFMSSCSSDPKDQAKVGGAGTEKVAMVTGREPFDPIIGIKFYEVKRRFSTGLSFNEIGFQQEPSWIIRFKSRDTIEAYSPQFDRM